MSQFRRKHKRTDYPPDVLKIKDDLYEIFCKDNPDLHGVERKKAWNRFIHKRFWSHIYQRVGQAKG